MRSTVAVLALATVSLAGCSGGGGAAEDPYQDLYWPFLDVTLPEGHAFRLFTQWPTAEQRPSLVGTTWVTERSGFYQGFFGEAGSVGNLTLEVLDDPDAPRFGVDGYNATRATIYVFIDTDELLAHTESIPLHELNRVPWIRGNPFTIGDEVYYLGDGETPNGTERLPDFLEPFKDDIRELAAGLPVGGASSILVPEEEAGLAGSLYGDLYVAAKVTELVYAP